GRHPSVPGHFDARRVPPPGRPGHAPPPRLPGVTQPARLELAGSTALVTGATGGIGDAIARTLGARGARLLLSGRREAELTRVAEDVAGTAIVADLSVAADVDRLGAQALEAEVDLLVANAAHPGTGMLADL